MRRNVIATALVAVLTVIATLCPQPAEARRGEVTVGVIGGYTTKNEAPQAGIFMQYTFAEHVRVAPDLGCAFRNKGLDNFFFDLNVHFPFSVARLVSLYPLAGFSYTSWNHHIAHGIDFDDVSTRVRRAGLNLGAGIDVNATRSLKLKFEAVYTINDGYSSFSPMVGIGYCF